MPSEEKKQKLVIIGAGLSGLVAVAESLKMAKADPNTTYELHVIEKRPLQFIRRQKLVIAKKRDFGYFSHHPSIYWDEYCKNLFNDQGSLNKRQRFLNKLNRQEECYLHPIFNTYTLRNFSIKELQLALIEHINDPQNKVPNVQIYWHPSTQLEAIDFQKKQIQLRDVKNSVTAILFDTIINCEGAKRETIQLINHSLKAFSSEQFEFEAFNFPVLYHCAVRLKLKADQHTHPLNRFFSSELSPQILLAKFKELGYQSEKLPNFFILDDNLYKQKELRMYIASEIPKAIHDIANGAEKRKAIIRWASLIAAMKYRLPETCFEFDSKGETDQHQMNALTFADHLSFVKKPLITLSNGVNIFLVGDASMSSFYPAGYSSTYALNEACLAIKLACQPSLNPQEFIQLYEFYKNYLRDELDALSYPFQRDFKSEWQQQKASC